MRHAIASLLVVPAFFFMHGCAAPLLQTHPAGEKEAAATLEAFARFQTLDATVCGCCFDAKADVALSVEGWFKDHTARFSGYLQAMAPAYFRFVATNQLGQPLFLLVSDGSFFRNLNVFQKKAYIGSVASETYRKFMPPGIEADLVYYWLTGRLPPTEIKVLEVMQSREDNAFWLRLSRAGGVTESMVLFDPENLVILRHVVRNGAGRELADFVYADYLFLPAAGATPKAAQPPSESASPLPEQEGCFLPSRVSVTASGDSKKLDITLNSFLGEAEFTAADFQLDIPDNFQQLFVR